MTDQKKSESDKRAIFDHIDSIFRAFADKDKEALIQTHMENWQGFTVRSRTVVRDRVQYLEEIGNFLEHQHWLSYEILEEQTTFHGDTAIVTYIAAITGEDSHHAPFESKLRIMDIYVKTSGKWNLAASSVSLHPDAIDRHLTAAIRARQNN
ncbi:MAG TPA: nuclear transport factor 2 family protein [Thermoanaerobaculia bacterium]|nr:nuclear transport factor 2 family protein [Thermoanaerobaculia bacterium]HUM28849.1 nuclear transport factor 2 family protein [Thermoanaerobaculia bacterium]HXK67217.1 nuclear transport factor 2 family protein [Thermoanaerobaculia bacterium]